ncbi:MAG: 50S ribosomal protein L11 methyltransferase [Vicinamibacterales bacterium]
MADAPAIEIRFPADPSATDGDAASTGDLLQAALMDFAVIAIDEGSPGSLIWRVFFTDAAERDRAAAVLAAGAPVPGLHLHPCDVPDEGWAARSQAGLTAVRVGRVVVTPPWDPAAHDRDADGTVTVVILPSMGFGTGHHATTRLCVAALQDVDLAGASVLDIGTGSGVLAIAAKRLGAATVLGIDDDPDAVAAARDSLALNPGVDVTLGVVDLRQSHLRPVDVVTANLTGGLLVATAPLLQRLGRRLILSGFLTHERHEVLGAFPGWTVDAEGAEDGWCSATLSRGPA